MGICEKDFVQWVRASQKKFAGIAKTFRPKGEHQRAAGKGTKKHGRPGAKQL